jgi:hypothetical protein
MKDMAKHLYEAIEINTHRTALYAELTNGESIKFSKKLIFMEKLTMLNAIFLDFFADRFQRLGVPVIKEDVVSMATIPEFNKAYSFEIHSAEEFKLLDAKSIVSDLNREYNIGGFEALARECDVKMDEVAHLPEYYCMYRHILESLRRLSNNASKHVSYAKQLGIKKSPLWLSRYNGWGHIFTIKAALNFDRDVLSIQSEGIPFLFQDLPHISAHSDFYIDKGI